MKCEAISHQLSTMHDLVTGTSPDYVLGDRSYGKDGVRILHVVKNGEILWKFVNCVNKSEQFFIQVWCIPLRNWKFQRD